MTCSARACVAPDQRDLSRVAVHRFGELRLRVSVPSAQRLHSLADNSSATARASGWGPSTVDGILRNLKCCGIWTWNRTGKRLDPRTGRRHSYAKPPEDHVVRTYPELRIISQSLWDDVQARRQAVAKVWPGGQRRGFTSAQGSRSDVYPSHLFDGMLRCACCKQAIGIVGGKAGGYYGCLAARRSACENRLTLCRSKLERIFLSALRDRLLDPAAIRYAFQRVAAEVAQVHGDVADIRSRKQAELCSARRELNNLVAFVRARPGV